MIGYKIFATCGGVGHIKGGGTIAAVLYTILWWFIRLPGINWPAQLIFFFVISVAGVVVSNRLEAIWGKDSSKIVIDEVAGMCCTLLFIPHHWQYAVTGLVLFRFFDIVKPFFIASAEKLPGGWGVMADDVAAGICANLLLQFILATNLV